MLKLVRILAFRSQKRPRQPETRGSRVTPRRPEGPQKGPKARDGLCWPDGPRATEDGPREPQDGPRGPQAAPKRTQKARRESQTWPRTAPKGASLCTPSGVPNCWGNTQPTSMAAISVDCSPRRRFQKALGGDDSPEASSRNGVGQSPSACFPVVLAARPLLKMASYR